MQIIDVEFTPNPQALKFVVNERLLSYESRSYKTEAEAEKDPFAKAIFGIEGVVSVFYMDKFVTVEKGGEFQWGPIQKKLIETVKNFEKANIPEEKIPEGLNVNESDLMKQINQVLDQKIRPALANDGGGLEVMGLEGLTLRVRYQGACGSCPSAQRGSLAAVEGLLRRDVHPGIQVLPS